jgi:hypothetical protein
MVLQNASVSTHYPPLLLMQVLLVLYMFLQCGVHNSSKNAVQLNLCLHYFDTPLLSVPNIPLSTKTSGKGYVPFRYTYLLKLQSLLKSFPGLLVSGTQVTQIFLVWQPYTWYCYLSFIMLHSATSKNYWQFNSAKEYKHYFLWFWFRPLIFI